MASLVAHEAPSLLVLASNNAKKLGELRSLFGELAIELQPQGQFGVVEADEPHETFVENALAKARHAARATGRAALADDSGLVVPALGGLPGVHSAHHAGVLQAEPGEDREQLRRRQDAANNTLLLEQLGRTADRRAAFVATLVAVRHAEDPEPLIAFGRWPLVVLTAPRGSGGFGYDPLVWVPELGASVADLSADMKAAHSHRARAAQSMRGLLRDVWGVPLTLRRDRR